MNANARGHLLLAGTFMLAFVACSGGGNPGGTIPPTGITDHGKANATLTITIPRRSGTGTSSSSSRGTASVRPDYISTNTQSMSIAYGKTLTINEIAHAAEQSAERPPPSVSI